MKTEVKIFLLILVASVFAVGLWVLRGDSTRQSIQSFEDCVAAGNPVMETFPEQCMAGDKLFVKQYKESEVTQNTTVRGVITRIEPNCDQVLELSDSGEIVSVDEPILCDAGSFIVVEGITIQVASGLIDNEEEMFEYDIGALKPGDTVSVDYKRLSDTTGTINCDGCGVVIE